MTTGGHNDESGLASALAAGSLQNGGQDAQHGALDGAGNSQARAGGGRLDLRRFAGFSDIRPYMNAPIKAGLMTLATNGHVLALVAGTEQADPENVGANAQGLAASALNFISAIAGLDFQTPPDVVPPDHRRCTACRGCGRATVTKCRECDGEGEVELQSDYNEYTCECKSCGGNGRTAELGGSVVCEECLGSGKVYDPWASVTVFGAHVQARYYDLISDLQGLQVCLGGPESSKTYGLAFRQVIDGKVESIGLIMGMRK